MRLTFPLLSRPQALHRIIPCRLIRPSSPATTLAEISRFNGFCEKEEAASMETIVGQEDPLTQALWCRRRT